MTQIIQDSKCIFKMAYSQHPQLRILVPCLEPALPQLDYCRAQYITVLAGNARKIRDVWTGASPCAFFARCQRWFIQCIFFFFFFVNRYLSPSSLCFILMCMIPVSTNQFTVWMGSCASRSPWTTLCGHANCILHVNFPLSAANFLHSFIHRYLYPCVCCSFCSVCLAGVSAKAFRKQDIPSMQLWFTVVKVWSIPPSYYLDLSFTSVTPELVEKHATLANLAAC